MAWWRTLTLAQLPGAGDEGSDEGAPFPPPSQHGEGVSRLATPAGEAAVVLQLARTVVAEGESVEFSLVNRGQVTLMSGQLFHVERWSGASWTALPPPRIGGVPLMFTDVGWLLEPGARTPTQTWPIREARVRPGWYRLVKSAVYEGGVTYGLAPTELVARTRVRVGARR